MSEDILNIESLSIKIKVSGSEKEIVKGVDLTIKESSIVALVGESGSGKSMIAQSILKLQDSKNFIYDGDIEFLKKSIFNLSPKELLNLRGNEISMIFQEPMSALNPLHKVYKQIEEIIVLHNKLKASEVKKRVYELLKKVELDRYGSLEKIAASYPHELSGGQRQRVMIAIALANSPKLLIADEPTTALDVTIQYQILELLKKLQIEHNMSVLLITHDLNIVKKYSDYVYVIKDALIVEHEKKEQLFSNPKEPYTKELLHTKIEKSSFESIENSDTILKVESLSVNFPIKKGVFKRVVDNFIAVDDVSFSLKKGECFGVIGESGSGKSTLAQALIKLIESDGVIIYEGKNIKNMKEKFFKPYRKDIQIVFQDPFNSLNPRMDIFSIVSEGLDIHTDLTKEQKIKRVEKILEDVELPKDSISRYPHEFSGGQRQRVAIARALILKPKLLILDEPTSALDRSVQFSLLKLLQRLQLKYSLTYIFISHDLEIVKSICNKILVMQKGKVVELDSSENIFEAPKMDYTRELVSFLK